MLKTNSKIFRNHIKNYVLENAKDENDELLPNENAALEEAVELLGDMLEQTPSEKERFSNDEAAEKLTYFIYKEIKKNGKEW